MYLWSEGSGAAPFPPWSQAHVTTIAFSSAAGGHDILAIGRINGLVSLWAVGEDCPRAEAKHSCGVAYVAWKPCLSRRYCLPGVSRECVRVEELLVGDEMGNVFYYAVEWATSIPGEPHPLEANMILIKRLNTHTQQICGITWSPDGEQVATGGNDNMCVLYDVNSGLPYDQDEPENEMVVRHKWPHSAAVKAIAFCPWQKSLVATGKYIKYKNMSNANQSRRWFKRSMHSFLSYLLWCYTRYFTCISTDYIFGLVDNSQRDCGYIWVCQSRASHQDCRFLMARMSQDCLNTMGR